MSLPFVNIDEPSFAFGMDARSAENQIDPGFLRDLLNADVVGKRARKRVGRQGYAGNLPIRATAVQYVNTENQLVFTLDTATGNAVDLAALRSSPIVVYGRLSSTETGGPFDPNEDVALYYPGFTIPTRRYFLNTGSSQLLTVTAAEHGMPSTRMYVGVVEHTNSVDLSHTDAIPHETEIDGASRDLTLTYTNGTGLSRSVGIYTLDQSSEVGKNYQATFSHTGTGSESFSVTAGTHGLSNLTEIQVHVFRDVAGDRIRIRPESVVITPSGTVTTTIVSGTSGTYYAILSATPITQQVTGNIAAGATQEITLTGITSPWVFHSVLLQVTPGGNYELVEADSTDYDADSETLTLSLTNSSGSARNFTVIWEYGELRSNRIAVTDPSITVDLVDTSPQVTIWGLDHTQLYGATHRDQAGWVTHIDSYRAPGEQRVVAGLGGNLYTARTYSEVGEEYLLPVLYPNLRARTDTDRTLAPLFWDTGETPGRTRGYITCDTGGTHWATLTAVSYDSGTGFTDYTLSVPGKQILDSSGAPTTLGSVISTTTSLEDWLTVEGGSYSCHNGTFRIRAVADGVGDTVTISVENESITTTDWDDSDLGGNAGVFTDRITFSSPGLYLIPGDSILNAAVDDMPISVIAATATTAVVEGVTELLDISGGLTTTGGRTSRVVPLRNGLPDGDPDTDNLLCGDILEYAGVSGRRLRTHYINSSADITVDITAPVDENDPATLTLTGGAETDVFSVGMSMILAGAAGVYSGVHTITAITSPTTMQFESTETIDVSGATLVGNTAELDEELEWNDTVGDVNSLTVHARWIPVEAPGGIPGEDSLLPRTHVRYLDSNELVEQPFLRSTTVVDNMYLTNYDDEVCKYDGGNLYRAGLPTWQPGLFLTVDTSPSAKIVADNPSTEPSAVSVNVFTVDLGEEQKFPPGSRIVHSHNSGSASYTVSATWNNATDGFVKVVKTVAGDITLGTSPTLTLISARRYYLRLNAVDANGNVIASAVTGWQDYVAELGTDAAVRIRGVCPPVWDNYDWDRLEVEIYATKLNTPAPFYRLTTLPVSTDAGGTGYLDFTDSFSDSDLLDLDPVNTALVGQELGTAWEQPLRAKYLTSVRNSLVLANVRDYPQLDIQFVAPANITSSAFDGESLLFRRDSDDPLTTSNATNRIRYEWVDGPTGTGLVSGDYALNANSFELDIVEEPTAGDWIYLSYETVGTADRDLTLCGWWQIADVDGAGPYTITVNYTDVPSPDDYPDCYTLASTAGTVPVLLGTDGSLGMANGDSYDLFDLMRRTALAINASMRMVDTSIAGYENYTPWLMARGGNDVARAGRLVVRQPRSDATTPEVVLPDAISDVSYFVNDLRRAAESTITATTRVFPSRLLVSYENYPEIYDNPTATLDSESSSAIDVNSADGQELTGVIPFFGDAAFGAAQQSGVLVAFKQNSAYLVDINEKRAGRNPVQRIETGGLGCTAPYSITQTPTGIMFANDSGMYRLTRDLRIEYVGKWMERNWLKQVDRSQLSIAQGHHWGIGRMYKLAVPLLDSDTPDEPSEAYVYNHTGESDPEIGRGAWSRYDNHSSTGWCNLSEDAYQATTRGRVLILRRAGDDTDYRDSADPISCVITLRPNAFGNPGIRKVLGETVVNYRVGDVTTSGTTVAYSVDLAEEFRESTQFRIVRGTQGSGVGDEIARSVATLAHSTDRRRGTYFSIQIANSQLDEPLEVAGVSFIVAGLNARGLTQARQTQSE